jgi:hypothetical protein
MNPNISATVHRIGVALVPLVVGGAAVLIKATEAQAWTSGDWWLLANAAVASGLTVYLNWVRGTSTESA